MALRACALLAGFSTASGMNIVNRKSNLCLDLHAPCVDGSADKDCQRVEPGTLTKGTNLQLFDCNGKKNQEFELTTNGRIKNPLTGLCLDIMAPCKDHFRKPCERVAVSELKKEANIQLYTCHEDEGMLSNSYGNQKFNFQGGELRNWLSNLCLEPVLDDKGKMVPEANIHTHTCVEAEYQKFDFVDASTSDPEEQGDSEEEGSEEATGGAGQAAVLVAQTVPAAALEAAVQQKFALPGHDLARAKFNSNFDNAMNDGPTQAVVGLACMSLIAVAVVATRKMRQQAATEEDDALLVVE